MTDVTDLLDNAFAQPELKPAPIKKGRMTEDYRKRFQLLDYDDVTALGDVMETSVPIDGKGNFPSLEVTPSTLVQMVRDGLSKEGIRVPSVRLNGSAATHVLSADSKHPYKDLDLIFAVDLSAYGDSSGKSDAFNNNLNNNNTYCRTKGNKLSSKRQSGTRASVDSSGPENLSESGEALPLTNIGDKLGSDVLDTKNDANSTTVLKTAVAEEEDAEDKDSGYTSSGSSVASSPLSPAGAWAHQKQTRSRTHSLESASSVTSSFHQGARCKDGRYLGVHPRRQRKGVTKNQDSPRNRSKESCWQRIKDVVMRILRDLLPVGVVSSRMTDAMLADAYVQKMVKISNEVDRWSLISLNNDAGRNLELKFVENMRRQYEFSVDSFQIILDSYQRFKIVSKSLERSREVELSPGFFPSVLAESVYGDFQAALRHLRYRRICTRRPEEIRGGGLLRYCNLRVRDFTLGEVEGYEDDVIDAAASEESVESATERAVTPFSSSGNASRLEQLMCSRFFIDFNDFACQQRKVLSYLESHFQSEDDMKFQYLLIVRRVVEKGTVCLMSNERSQIVDFIKKMALETLAKVVKGQVLQATPSCVAMYSQPNYPFQSPSYPVVCPTQLHETNRNNCTNYHFQSVPPSNYAPSNIYPQYQHHPPLNIEPSYPPVALDEISVALCPCCKSTFSYSAGTPTSPQVVVTPPQHTMSVNSPPFYPRRRGSVPGAPTSHLGNASITAPVVYLDENSTLIYSTGSCPVTSV